MFRKLHTAICMVAATAMMAGCGDDSENNGSNPCVAGEIRYQGADGTALCGVDCTDSVSACSAMQRCSAVGTSGSKVCVDNTNTNITNTNTMMTDTGGDETTASNTTVTNTTNNTNTNDTTSTNTTGTSTTGTSTTGTSTTGTSTTGTSTTGTSTTGTSTTSTSSTGTTMQTPTEVGKACTQSGMPFGTSADCTAPLGCWPESVMTSAGATATGITGGACTLNCSADPSICPMDTICTGTGFSNDSGNINLCMETCVTKADCSHPGQECATFRGSAQTVCIRPQVGASAGSACARGADCGGITAQCQLAYPGGSCSSNCSSNADCPAAAGQTVHCDVGGSCKQTCTVDTDCRQAEGYVCADLDGDNIKECAPSGPALNLGGACERANPRNLFGQSQPNQCGAGTICWGEQVPVSNGMFAPSDYPGGYCTIRCDEDETVCGVGARCVDTGFGFGPSMPIKICVNSCTAATAATDCPRAGYSCIDTDMDNVPDTCGEALGTQELGDSCGRDTDCGGVGLGANGICWAEAFNNGALKSGFPGGYCTLRCTADATVCGAGSVCFDTGIRQGPEGTPNTKICIDPCGMDNDCRTAEGYACVDKNGDGTADSCLISPTAPIGAACIRGQCANDGVCLTDDGNRYLNGYCTADCSMNAAACGMGSTCRTIPTVGTRALCFDDCTADADCRVAEGYTCVDTDATAGGDTCLRIGSGMGAVGDACTGVSDCSGGLDAECIPEGVNAMGQVVRPGGICSAVCIRPTMMGAPDPCGPDATCTTFGMAPNTFSRCIEKCAANGTCDRMGYQCVQGNICL